MMQFCDNAKWFFLGAYDYLLNVSELESTL